MTDDQKAATKAKAKERWANRTDEERAADNAKQNERWANRTDEDRAADNAKRHDFLRLRLLHLLLVEEVLPPW